MFFLLNDFLCKSAIFDDKKCLKMHFQGLFSGKSRVERSSKSFKRGFWGFCLNLSHQY